MKRFVDTHHLWGIVLAGAACLCTGATARATTFTDRGQFLGAIGHSETVDFNQLIDPMNADGFTSIQSSFTLGPATFSIDPTNEPDAAFFAISSKFPPPAGNLYTTTETVLSSQSLDSSVNSANIVISLPGPGTSAIGLDYSVFNPAEVDFTFKLADGTSFTQSDTNAPGIPANTFLGVTSPIGITELDISTDNGGTLQIGDLVVATPLPNSAWGGLALMAGMAIVFKSRRHKVATIVG